MPKMFVVLNDIIWTWKKVHTERAVGDLIFLILTYLQYRTSHFHIPKKIMVLSHFFHKKKLIFRDNFWLIYIRIYAVFGTIWEIIMVFEFLVGILFLMRYFRSLPKGWSLMPDLYKYNHDYHNYDHIWVSLYILSLLFSYFHEKPSDTIKIKV